MAKWTLSDPTGIEMKARGRSHPAATEVVVAPRTLVALVMVSLGGLLLLAVAYTARVVLIELSAAIVLAMALEPAVQAFQRRGMVRSGAVAVTYAIAAVVVSAFLLIMLPPLVDGVARFVREAPGLVRQLAREHPQLGFIERHFNVVEDIRARMTEQGGALSISRSAFDFVGKVFHSQTAAVSIVFLSFFIAIDGRRWCAGILGLMPDASRERWRRIGSGVAGVVGGYVFGNVLISAIAGTVATLVLLVMRVPYAVPLGLLYAFLDLIPLVGALLGTVIIGAVALTQGVATSGIVAAALLLYQQFENGTLSQLVYNRTVKISALAVAVSVLAGAEIAGIPGTLLAIPVAGSLKVITRELLAWGRGVDPAREPAEEPATPRRTPWLAGPWNRQSHTGRK
jgi:predicted PurR-regulated permease PerM